MSRRQLQRPAATSVPADRRAGAAPDDSGCHVLHVDMDAFYASVELRERPELVGRPVIVGAPGARGVVLSATYEARRFGVHSAMPMTRARRLCPQATVIAPEFSHYQAASRGVMEIFRAVTPLVEPLSLDEAFLDVTGSRRLFGRPAQIGEYIRARVADEQGITCSVGVATTKFVAKLASTSCKPDALRVVPADGVVGFLHPLPVGALWGVGERTEETLLRLGLHTVGDLAHVPVGTLQKALGDSLGAHLHARSWGRDERRVTPDEPTKSVGADETFDTDVTDPDLVRRELLRLSERTAARLRGAGQVGRTISIKVRFADFTTITRSRTLRDPTDVGREIYATVRALYDALGLERARLRLVGVRVEGIGPADDRTEQLALPDPARDRPVSWRDAELAADRAARRFGAGAVRPASLVSRERPDEPPDE